MEQEISIDDLLADAEEISPNFAPLTHQKLDIAAAEEAARDRANHKRTPFEVDLSIQSFEPVEKYFEDVPSEVFNDTKYYNTALSGEGDSAQRVHAVLTKYLTCQDPKDRTVYRQQLVSAYWELIHVVGPKMGNPKISMPKRLMIRYGVILPSLFTPEQKDTFARAIIDNVSGEPVLYLDEWFKSIATGKLTLSATDEAKPKRSSATSGGSEEQMRIMALKNKNDGKLQSAENFCQMKENERKNLENTINQLFERLCEHPSAIGLEPHKEPYTEDQKRIFPQIAENMRSLQKIDKELTGYLKELQEAKGIDESLDAKMSESSATIEVDRADLETEFNTIRQMAKMTVGRQGNQFPIFTREFFHCIPKGTGFRENVIDTLAWIESLDPGAFCRIHRNVPNRIVPYVLLAPTYGDTGFCWEPFDRYNRLTSRGRIVVPMYPRDLKIAVLTAVADLRWQVAKEKASFYWMEEGLTGQYYQWIESQKLKGDLKKYFIDDYVLWMTKESEGVQRLSKEVRGIFWRHIPFAQDIKEELKKRSTVYQELYQRDINRSMSDGY